MVVVDFGVGSGTYSFLASRAVGSGKVYALDIQRDLLDKVQKEASSRGFSNIEILSADFEKPESTRLRENSVDAGIVSNTLFLVQEKKVFIEEIKRVLRDGGRVLVVDWADSFGGLGPQTEHVLSEDNAQKLFKENGFTIEKVLYDAGDHHYGFIAKLEKSQ